QNYPNPFNQSTEISFSIPARSHVEITIYNLLGQLVREVIDQAYRSGDHRVRWDGRDHANTPVSSGVYLVRMTTDAGAFTKKMILLR
ncbi:MAG: T9SS type A sorting domain-containing protein, partial [Candidatus Latescibacteria bacterium]|nr:T9SS type A sorting domain-containing protein [Candidatus Latescibacterota bacterium]